ncbi:hypothetical protein PsorP6_003320 [Peronosclerospora sorghi]|uniref:Uncharacterized protein n=1 Tax=Peronosclerospora sorghi TaxID=230839 RepID=A0ACC0VPS9_9STRA|nr:hypothetical protein PsorP6_003320 [Peronosclerospora sorghi]
MSRLPLLWALVVQEEEEEEELRDQHLWLEIARVRLATRVRNYVTAAALPRPFESPWAMLDRVADAEVRWPTAQEQVAWGRLMKTREPIVTKKFGFIDGKNYQVQQQSRAEVQNAYLQRLASQRDCYGYDGLRRGWLHLPDEAQLPRLVERWRDEPGVPP